MGAAPIKITYRELVDLHSALNSLDAIRNGKDEIISFEFDVPTRLALLRTSAEVARHKAIFDKLDRESATQAGVYEGMDQTDANAKKLDAYRRKVEEAKEAAVEFSVEKVTLDQLLTRPPGPLKKNPIAQSVINRLFPILNLE